MDVEQYRRRDGVRERSGQRAFNGFRDDHRDER